MLNDRFNLRKILSAFVRRSRRKSSHIKDKTGINSQIHLAVNEHGIPIKFIVADGARSDSKKAVNLLKNIDAKLLFADRVYDTNEILFCIVKRNRKLIIYPKCNKLK